jgi:hypothetical protein
MADDTNKLNIDVVLGDQTSSTVTNPVFYPHNVQVLLPGTDGAPGPAGGVGAQGEQGPTGPDGDFTPDGPEGSVQFKAIAGNSINFSGISQFHFDKSTHFLTVSGGGVLINEGQFHITGSLAQSERFLIKDGDSNLLKVDTSNKKITFSENAAINEYYLGVGVNNPLERLHVGNGNLRVDGQIKAGGHIIPVISGEYDLGSPASPFRDIYIDGNSIHFVNSKAKLTSSLTEGIKIVQTVPGAAGIPEEKNLLNIDTHGNMTLSGIMSGNLPYNNITDGFLFIEKDINIGEQYIPVEFGATLSYDPTIVVSVSAPEEAVEVYGVSVAEISVTGFYASLTAKAQKPFNMPTDGDKSGYSLIGFVSPKAKNASIIKL